MPNLPHPSRSLRSRRSILRGGALLTLANLLRSPAPLLAQGGLATLEIASAGSMRAALEGPLKQAAAKELGLDLHIHAGGADGVARSIVDGSLGADVFIPVTAAPLHTVIGAGGASEAFPIASTEMVILYSNKSRFAPQFADAAAGRREWWTVLEQPGIRFARSNPLDDPSGRAILFTMMLASRKYTRPDLVEKILGTPFNLEQIHPGTDIRSALENGTIDAAGSYRIATRLGKIPFLLLPADVNLSDPLVGTPHPDLVLHLGEKTFHVEPLIFYAAALNTAKNPEAALRFLSWLRSKDVAAMLQTEGFALPSGAAKLT